MPWWSAYHRSCLKVAIGYKTSKNPKYPASGGGVPGVARLPHCSAPWAVGCSPPSDEEVVLETQMSRPTSSNMPAGTLQASNKAPQECPKIMSGVAGTDSPQPAEAAALLSLVRNSRKFIVPQVHMNQCKGTQSRQSLSSATDSG